MSKESILFVCIHNSARSQMAEAYLNKFGQDRFEAESAGLEPGTLNPFVVEVMKEDGIDISANKTDSVFDFYKEGRRYHYVFTVCDKKASEQCPVFPNAIERINWNFPDPLTVEGDDSEKLAGIRAIRDMIKEAVMQWVAEKLK